MADTEDDDKGGEKVVPKATWLSGKTTTKVGSRFLLTNDVLAGVLVSSLPLLIYLDALGEITLSAVPDSVVSGYLVAVGIAVVWTFGKDPLVAWMERK